MNNTGKKILVFLTAMAVIAAAGWFGRKAYKSASELRLVHQASDYLAHKDQKNAALCLQRVLQVNPMSPTASALMADLLESVGSSGSLKWRAHAAELRPENCEYLFAWARTALKMQDLNSAALALRGLKEPARSSATGHKLLGALAWESHDFANAESHYDQALRLEPSNITNSLNLATVHLVSTNKAVAQEARLALKQIPANSPLRLVALQYLIADAVKRHALPEAVSYSEERLKNPEVSAADKVQHLQLLRTSTSPDSAKWLDSLKSEASGSSDMASQLGKWMNSVDGPTNTLAWLRTLPTAVQTNWPLPLLLTDCLIATKDWNGLLAIVEEPDWGEANSYRLALEVLARRSLGQKVASDTAWRKALRECSQRLDRLARLAKVTDLWGWKLEKTEVLHEIVKDFPKEKWAVDQIIGELYVAGNTLELTEVLKEVSAADPSDARMKNWLANVFLLRKVELERAYRLASEAYNSSTNNPFFISTYAYSLFLQKKEPEAVKLVAGIRPEDLQIPSIAAYYGFIQARAGHKDMAEPTLQRAKAAILLPEEKEIVRLALAQP